MTSRSTRATSRISPALASRSSTPGTQNESSGNAARAGEAVHGATRSGAHRRGGGSGSLALHGILHRQHPQPEHASGVCTRLPPPSLERWLPSPGQGTEIAARILRTRLSLFCVVRDTYNASARGALGILTRYNRHGPRL